MGSEREPLLNLAMFPSWDICQIKVVSFKANSPQGQLTDLRSAPSETVCYAARCCSCELSPDLSTDGLR